MERLVFALLKLLLRLVLFAWTGDWNKLDKLIAQFREQLEALKKQARAPQPRPTFQREKQRPARTVPGLATPPPDWPFEFAPEALELEPMEELHGGEEAAVSSPVLRPRVPRAPRVAPASLPLRTAIRRPELVRDALILTAALGQHRPRAPRR